MDKVTVTKQLCDLLRESDYKLWYSSCSGSTGAEDKWKFQSYFGWDYKPDGSNSVFDSYVKQINSNKELNASDTKKQAMSELGLNNPSGYSDKDTQSIYLKCLELNETQVRKLLTLTKTTIKSWISSQYAADKQAELTDTSIDNLVNTLLKKL